MKKHTVTQKINIYTLTQLALFTALGLALYGIESALPTLIPIPGVKLGLANVVTLIVMKRNGKGSAALVLSARILLSALLFGQGLSLLYSLCGGLLCLLAEIVSNALLEGHFLTLISIVGALFHNLGQLLLARLIMNSPAVFSYLPYLILSGIVTGLLIGIASAGTLRLLNRHFPSEAHREAP